MPFTSPAKLVTLADIIHHWLLYSTVPANLRPTFTQCATWWHVVTTRCWMISNLKCHTNIHPGLLSASRIWTLLLEHLLLGQYYVTLYFNTVLQVLRGHPSAPSRWNHKTCQLSQQVNFNRNLYFQFLDRVVASQKRVVEKRGLSRRGVMYLYCPVTNGYARLCITSLCI